MTSDEKADRARLGLLAVALAAAGAALLNAREAGVYDIQPPVLIAALVGTVCVCYGIGRLRPQAGRNVAAVLAIGAILAELVVARARTS